MQCVTISLQASQTDRPRFARSGTRWQNWLVGKCPQKQGVIPRVVNLFLFLRPTASDSFLDPQASPRRPPSARNHPQPANPVQPLGVASTPATTSKDKAAPAVTNRREAEIPPDAFPRKTCARPNDCPTGPGSECQAETDGQRPLATPISSVRAPQCGTPPRGHDSQPARVTAH
jgi:hypothetical protein